MTQQIDSQSGRNQMHEQLGDFSPINLFAVSSQMISAHFEVLEVPDFRCRCDERGEGKFANANLR